MRKHRRGSISFKIGDLYKDFKTKIKEQLLKKLAGKRDAKIRN